MTDVDEAAAPPEPQRPSRGRALKAVARIAVGAAIIALLLSRSDVSAIADTIRGARRGPIAGALGLLLAGLVVSAFRWQAFLRPLGIGLRAGPLLRLTFAGMFFNAFLPTGVGGDAYKAMRLRRGPGTLGDALASVLLDRIAGVAGLSIVGLSAVAWRAGAGDLPGTASRGEQVLGAALGVSLAFIAAAGLVVFGGARLLGRQAKELSVRWKLQRTLASLAGAGREPRAFAAGVGGGIAFQGLLVWAHVLVASALGLEVPAGALAAIVVLATLATMVPVTINGLGLREGVYAWALGAYGASQEQALAFGLLVLGVLLATSAAGGLVYVAAGGEIADDDFIEPPAG